ncbi:hypothetical protein [Polaribacter sp.]|uniref:hypothetical protein n=1 Tax=Polaribacter sp. TaxID=1920175 RepID=UPI004047A203
MTQDKVEQVNYLILYSEYILWLLGVIVLGLGYIIKIQYEKIKEIKSQLSEKKYELYLKIYTVFFELVEKKAKNENPAKKIENLISEIKKEMFIYAPDNIVKKFLEWNNNDNNEKNTLKRLDFFNELLVMIRKDMGNPKSKITKDDLIRSVLSSHEEFLKFKKSIM